MSCKEAIYNHYLAFCRKDILEKLTSLKFADVKREYYFMGRKIDIFARDADFNREVFIEVQLGTADKNHLNQIKKIICKIDKPSVIVWISTSFNNRDNMIEELLDYARQENKEINFFALTIDSKVITILEEINSGHIIRTLDNLYKLNKVENQLSIYYKYLGKALKEAVPLDLVPINNYEYTNRQIIEYTREGAKYLNFFSEKKNLDCNNLTFGAGQAGIYINIVFFGKSNESCVQLKFDDREENTGEIFNFIYAKREILKRKMKREIEFDCDNLVITIFVDSKQHKFLKLENIAKITNDLIYYLCNYTVYWNYNDRERMWLMHKEGML